MVPMPRVVKSAVRGVSAIRAASAFGSKRCSSGVNSSLRSFWREGRTERREEEKLELNQTCELVAVNGGAAPPNPLSAECFEAQHCGGFGRLWGAGGCLKGWEGRKRGISRAETLLAIGEFF